MKNILTITKLGLISAVVAVGFIGCASKTVKVENINTIKEDKIINFVSDKITDKQINLEYINFSSNIQSLSNYRYLQRGKCPIFDITGTKVTKKGKDYLIEYIRGNKHCGTGSIFETKFIYLLETKINKQKIIFSYPKTYKFINSTDAIGVPIKPLDKKSNIQKDFDNIFKNLEKIRIYKTYSFKGEVNTKYPDKAIYANFKRLVGQYIWSRNERISEIRKKNTFSLTFDNQKYPLYVEVVPYRNGSKVIYSAKIPYWISGEGKSNLSKEAIEELHKKIKEVIDN